MTRIYGQWAKEEDPERCIEEVFPQGFWLRSYQCTRKRGHGPNGERCKQHAKREEAREDTMWLGR